MCSYSSMSNVVQKLAASVGMVATISAVIYSAGRYSEVTDSLVTRVARAEEASTHIRDVVVDLHARVLNMEKDIKTLLKKSR